MERRQAPPDRIDRVLPEMFGRNHDSLVLYIETVCVDARGYPDLRRLSCNPERHPQFVAAGSGGWSVKYSTTLRDGTELPGHDDWDAVDDLVAAGLLEWRGTGVNPRFWLTDSGWARAHELRRKRAEKAFKT